MINSIPKVIIALMVLKCPEIYFIPLGMGVSQHLHYILSPPLFQGPQCTVMEHFLLIRVLGQIVGIEDVRQQENGELG